MYGFVGGFRQAKREIVPYTQAREHAVLEHDAGAPAEGFERIVLDRAPIEQDPSLVRVAQA